jgi:hypothetical protein
MIEVVKERRRQMDSKMLGEKRKYILFRYAPECARSHSCLKAPENRLLDTVALNAPRSFASYTVQAPAAKLGRSARDGRRTFEASMSYSTPKGLENRRNYLPTRLDAADWRS